MELKYKLKTIWFYLFISFVFCTIFSTSITYFLDNDIKLIKLIIDSTFYSLSLFHFFMYFIVRFSILSKDKKKNKHRHRVDFLFEQTGIALLKNTEPKINYFFLKYTLISIISSFIIFMLWILFTEDINTDYIKNDFVDFFIDMLFIQIAINTFAWYFLEPIIKEIIIKQLCYTLKKPIYNGSYLYLNNEKGIIENNKLSFCEKDISIYKNGKLHCERLPACVFNVFIKKNKNNASSSFLFSHQEIKNMSVEELESYYEKELQRNKQYWFLNGKIFEPSQKLNDYKSIRNVIKLKQSVNNF